MTLRSIQLNLWQNVGTTTPGALQVLSGQVEDLAELTQEVDGTNKLTKATPSDLTCKVLDPTGAIWSFVQNQLGNVAIWGPSVAYAFGTMVKNGANVYQCAVAGTSASSGGPTGTGTGITDNTVTWNYLANPPKGLLPPWLELYVGGVRMFLGTADPSRITNHKSAEDYSIEIGAVDWSMQLSTSYLGSPTALPWQPLTPYGVGATCLNGGSVYVVTPGGAGTSAATGGPAGALPSTDGTVTWAYRAPLWTRPLPSAANNASATVAPGIYAPWSWVGFGTLGNMNMVWFPDPCAWIYGGAILTLTTRPILMADLKSTGPSGVYITSSAQLPAPATLPTGLIVQIHGGAQYQNNGSAWVSVYDTSVPAGSFRVAPSPQDQQIYAGVSYLFATLNMTPWPLTTNNTYASAIVNFLLPFCSGLTASFTLAAPTAADLDYWTTQVAVPSNPSPACYTLMLNSVAGIVVGDSISIVNSDLSGSWTVAGVDPILCQVTTTQSVSGVPLGTHLYWSTASQAEMVMEDPNVILPKACQPFGCDLSKFTAPNTADPMFGYLPLRPASGNDLWPIGDIEPTLTGIKLSTGATWVDPITGAAIASYSWTGNPSSGWTGPVSTAPAAPKADWTCQLAAAPSSLMPYEVCSPTVDSPNGPINPWQRLRNRAYGDVSYRRENNGLIILVVSGTYSYVVNGAYVLTTNSGGPVYTYVQNGSTYTSTNVNDVFSPWSPTGADLAGPLAVYDYTAMRRLVITGSAVAVKAWSGSAWGTVANYTWPGGAGPYVQSAVPMIGTANAILSYTVDASIGATINNSLWGATNSRINDRIELWNLSGALTNTGNSTPLYVPAPLMGGTLVSTPYAVYLVGASSLAQVIYNSTTHTLSFGPILYLLDTVDFLFANTLVARTSSEIVIFGRSDVGSTSTTTETWMLRISTPFVSVLDTSVLWSEKVSEGCPALMGAIRDPSKAGRIVGHLGGSLFQVDTTRPFCIERFTPGGMTALELVEHICQMFNAVAVPDANGTMHIISRVQSDSATPITVNQVSVKSTCSWPDFASIVRITSQNNNYYYDSYGQQGGILLEVGNHPLCWSLSSCAAMSESLSVWFGQPRTLSDEEWFYTDPTTAAPWEALQCFQKLTVNGGSNVRLMSLSQNFVTGTARVKTVGA